MWTMKTFASGNCSLGLGFAIPRDLSSSLFAGLCIAIPRDSSSSLFAGLWIAIPSVLFSSLFAGLWIAIPRDFIFFFVRWALDCHSQGSQA